MPDTFLALTFKFKSLVLKAIREVGIDVVPMEIQSLHLINRIEGCTAALMSEKMERDKGQIARLIREMIEKGLIDKSPNPKDTRSHLLQLTTQGQAILSRMLEIENAIIEKMQSNITHEQIAKFNDVALAMTKNLKE
jgi:DNA-binding MarR family transcriptional regulator